MQPAESGGLTPRAPRAQGWWILCTATLCALPLTIWEFKNQGWSPHYQGANTTEAIPLAVRPEAVVIYKHTAAEPSRSAGQAQQAADGDGQQRATRVLRACVRARTRRPPRRCGNSGPAPARSPPQPGSSAAYSSS